MLRAILASGLQLKGAKVDGLLRLDYQNVEGPVRLCDCELAGLSANDANFKNVVDFSSTTFAGDLDFLGATFERVLKIGGATVKGDASFWAAQLKSGLSARKLKVTGIFNARELRVAASAAFDGACFCGEVWFRRAHVEQTLSLADARARSPVWLNGATVADVDLSGAKFDREVSLRGVHVSETLRLNGACLAGSVTFDECQVRDLEITAGGSGEGPRFHGRVVFGGGSVSTLVTVANAIFFTDVFLGGFHAGGLRLVNSEFRGWLALGDVHVERSASVFGCSFAGDFDAQNLDIAGTAAFESLDVRGAVSMTGANFGSDARFRGVRSCRIDLSGANVAGRLRFEGDGNCVQAGPNGVEPAFKLENVTVAQDVRLDVAVVGDVELRGLKVQGSIDFGRFTVTRAQGLPQGPNAPPPLHAAFLSVGRDLTFGEAVAVAEKVDLTGAKVAGTLSFGGSLLPPAISLNSATLGTLEFKQPAPGAAVEIDMVGCTYDTMVGGPQWLIRRFRCENQAVVPLPLGLGRVFGSPSSRPMPDRQPFLRLEEVLRSGGHDEEANNVFYTGRMLTRWKSSFLQWGPQWAFTGFGVRPLRLLAWIVLLWAVAWAFFATASGSVRNISLAARTDPTTHAVQPVDERQHSCGQDRADWLQAGQVALEQFVPATFPNSELVVTPSCPVTMIWGTRVGPAATEFVIFLLKLGGLILIPLGVLSVSGVLRPPARA